MDNQVPKLLQGHFIFLPANVAITAMNNGTAVQTIFFFSFRTMRQGEYFLKNKYNIYILAMILYKSGIFGNKTISFI